MHSSPMLRARRLLGLEGGVLDLRRLKSRYKSLMKVYHPDLNPQGLRRCQEINAAYALLAAGLTAGPASGRPAG
jgi:curved DNA-binding protein CbpA